jgi:hypothetical protein
MTHYLSPQNLFDGGMLLLVLAGGFATWSNSKAAKRSGDEKDAEISIRIKDAAITSLQQENTFLKTQNAKYGERIAVLETDNKRLQAVVDNRNPELEKFMRETSASILVIEASINQLLKLHLTPSPVTINNQPNG